MLQKLKNRKQGFTIIEVLIVLAIAGLILLIVFLAVPALQRNSKNTQRKNDVQAVLGAVQEFTNNNSGQLPADTADAFNMMANAKLGFYQANLGAAPKAGTALSAAYAPNGSDINIMIANAAIQKNNQFPVLGTMYIRFGAKCDSTTNDFTSAGASSRSVAIGYTIDTSSGTKPVCQES